MEWLDEEPKKKKKKQKAKKPKKPPPREKKFYEDELARVNARLASLLRESERREKKNRALATELVAIEDERTDVCQHLDRQILQRKNTITIVEESLIRIQKELTEYKETSERKISELKKQYDSEHALLQKEIELQKTTLAALERDRVARTVALAKINQKHNDIDILNEEITNELFDMERKAVVQKNMLKKEVEERIENLVKDVVHSNEIRKAGYIRTLLQENVSLRDRMDKLVLQTIRTMQIHEREMLKSTETIESYVALEQLTKHLSRVINNKKAVVQNLLVRIERMRLSYLETRRYYRFHQVAHKRGLFQDRRRKSFQEINDYLSRLAEEKKAIVETQRSQEQELEYMLSMLERLRSKIEGTIVALMNLGPDEVLDPVERRSTVEEMIFMTTFMSPRFIQCKSKPRPIYHRGSCGILRPNDDSEMPFISQLDIYDDDAMVSHLERGRFDYRTKLTKGTLTAEQRNELEKMFNEILIEVDLPSDFLKTSYRLRECQIPLSSCESRSTSSNSET